MSNREASERFDRLVTETHSLSGLIHNLFEKYQWKDIDLANKLIYSSRLRTQNRKVRTIGIYYHKMFAGGTQRVISLQIPILLELGYKIVLFTETIAPEKEYPIDPSVIRVELPFKYSDNRSQILSQSLKRHNVDLLIYHAHLSRNLLFDLLLTKCMNISFFIYRHGTFIHNFKLHDQRTSTIYPIYRLSDYVLTVSKMEESFATIMGVRAHCIPNQIQFPTAYPAYNKNKGIILWIGRLCNHEKNFQAALDIMKEVVKTHKKAQMVIVGPEYDTGSGRSVLDYIQTNRLEHNIKWVGSSEDVSMWYKQAKLMLFTSPYESFPMVVAESKSFGIPLVTFSIPWLDLLRDGKGFISVPQNDIKSAANAVSLLLNNATMCEILSSEALESLEPFRRFDHRKEWMSIFKLYESESSWNASSIDRTLSIDEAKLILDVLLAESERVRCK